MRGVKGPGVPRGRRAPPTNRAGARLRGSSLGKGAQKAAAGKAAAGKAAIAKGEELDGDETDVAFMRKHAADLEEESRRHVSAEAGAERMREEEEEQSRRKVQGFSFDERRKKRGRRFDENDDADSEEAEAEARAKEMVGGGGSRGQLFSSAPTDRLGDLELTDPQEMQRVLGTSVRFAQHAMILAEAKLADGASRASAIAYLAGLYDALDDRAYAEKALRLFGPGTGIVDLYPLEVVDHLLEHVPGFVQRTRRAALFGGQLRVRARPKAKIRLEYDENLRVRGFALRGGPRPGYRFEPVDPPGVYELSIDGEGRFEVLISAITKDGWLWLDTLDADISASAPDGPEVHIERSEPVEESPHAVESPAPGETSRRLPNELSKLSFPRRI